MSIVEQGTESRTILLKFHPIFYIQSRTHNEMALVTHENGWMDNNALMSRSDPGHRHVSCYMRPSITVVKPCTCFYFEPLLRKFNEWYGLIDLLCHLAKWRKLIWLLVYWLICAGKYSAGNVRQHINVFLALIRFSKSADSGKLLKSCEFEW